MRITRSSRPSAAVCTLGRSMPERALQSDRHQYDDENCDKARRLIKRECAEFLHAHPEVTSMRVVASARYGGYTVEQYDRSDLA